MRDWLKKIRRDKCWTVKKAAEEMGISAAYLDKIERGERDVPVKTAKKIAEILGFDWQVFFEEGCK